MSHGVKTYIPRLVYLLELACKYVGRWQFKLEHYLTDEQQLLLDAVVTACQAFVTSVEESESA